MKSRNGKPTEDPLCSKKEKHRWFSLYLSFLLQISREFHFSLYSFFLSVAIRFLHEYIYIYIYIYIFVIVYLCGMVLDAFAERGYIHTYIHTYTLY